MDVYTLLILGHLIGTVLAVGGATLIEVQLNQALRDGTMTGDERDMLGLDFTLLRVGLILSVFTGIGFVINMVARGSEHWLQNPVLWAKMTILLIVVVNALLLQAHKINLYWGSAVSFVGWWSIFLLGVFITQGVRYGFFEIMIAFVVLLSLGALILHKIRECIKSKHTVV